MVTNAAVETRAAKPVLVWGAAALLTLAVAGALGVMFGGGDGVNGAPFEPLESRHLAILAVVSIPGPLLAAVLFTLRRWWAKPLGYAALAGAAVWAGFMGGIAAFFTLCLDSPPEPCGIPPGARAVLVAMAVASLVPGALLHAFLLRRPRSAS